VAGLAVVVWAFFLPRGEGLSEVFFPRVEASTAFLETDFEALSFERIA